MTGKHWIKPSNIVSAGHSLPVKPWKSYWSLSEPLKLFKGIISPGLFTSGGPLAHGTPLWELEDVPSELIQPGTGSQFSVHCMDQVGGPICPLNQGLTCCEPTCTFVHLGHGLSHKMMVRMKWRYFAKCKVYHKCKRMHRLKCNQKLPFKPEI